jgi:hypothetical protein
MNDGALALYKSFEDYSHIQELIDNAEAEGIHLECKAPATTKLARDLRIHLAKGLSGFSNTDGGVIIWGVSTTKHAHSGLDVITQLEPMGSCIKFSQQIEKTIPSLATPAIYGAKVKIIKERAKDTKGIVIAYIPMIDGDPVQSNLDNKFYYRSGDGFQIAPYSMIKRLFAASETPDIYPTIPEGLVIIKKDGFWDIPIAVENRSSAIGEHVYATVRILNFESCDAIQTKQFDDVSHLNPGEKLYQVTVGGVVYRGINTIIGNILVKMKVEKRTKRALRLEISLYANKMRARGIVFNLLLSQKSIKVRKESEIFKY